MIWVQVVGRGEFDLIEILQLQKPRIYSVSETKGLKDGTYSSTDTKVSLLGRRPQSAFPRGWTSWQSS